MDNNSIRCPYCGKKMSAAQMSGGSCYYRCRSCNSTSPVAFSLTDAYERAIVRAPMSDFELIEAIKRNPRAELRLSAPLTQEEARTYLQEEDTPLWMERADSTAGRWMLSIEARRLLELSENSYGKTFVFWKTVPTEEERNAAHSFE